MADLLPVLREVKGVWSDRARDRLPDQSVWNMTDWIPEVLQAGVRMRGAWIFQSTDLTLDPTGMLYAPFAAGSRLLVALKGELVAVPESTPGGWTAITPLPAVGTVQNPVFHRNRVIIPGGDGAAVPVYVTWDGATFTATNAPVSAPHARYATVWKDRLVLGLGTSVYFSKPGDPTIAWDALSVVPTSYDLTGLAAQRTQVLAFHAASVERLRGTTPPDSTLTDPTGDLLLDVLWDKAGCYDARSIAYWNDNVIFADSRGMHLTDGAIVRNLAVQGGVINLYRSIFNRGGQPDSIGGTVHQDYYICTLRKAGFSPRTFVVHLPTRAAFMLTNIDSLCFAASVGTAEKVFGVDMATRRVTDLTPVFSPDPTILQVDGNGVSVLPSIETGWSRLDRRWPGFKQVQELHLSVLAVRDDDVDVLRTYYIGTPTGADVLLGELRTTNAYRRKRLDVGRRLEGVAFRVDQLQPTKDSRIYDISVRAYADDQGKLRTS